MRGIIVILFLIYLIYALGVWFFVLIGVIILVVIIYSVLSSPTISYDHKKSKANNHYNNTSTTTTSHRERNTSISLRNEKRTTHIQSKSQTQQLSEFVVQLLEHNPDMATLKAMSRMQKYESSIIKSPNANSRAFDLLIGCAENTINTIGPSNHKQRIVTECNLIIYIAKKLKVGISNEQIIKSILKAGGDIISSKPIKYDSELSDNIETKINVQKELIIDFISLAAHTNNQQLANSTKRLERYMSSFKESIWCKDDLFKHITGISNNTILISRHSPDKATTVKECQTINYIIENLIKKQCADILIEDIVRNSATTQENENEVEKRVKVASIVQSLSTYASIQDKISVIETNKEGQNIIDNNQVVIPLWAHCYIYSVNDLNQANDEQKTFYYYFKSEFLNNNCIDISDNSNYAFVLMFDLVEDYKKHKDLDKVQEQLSILGANYHKTSRYTKQVLNRAIHNEPTSTSTLSVNINVSDILSRFNNESAQSKEKLSQKCKWIDQGEDIEVSGVRLKRGNFYLGEKFLLPEEHRSYWNTDTPYLFASVLNTELPVSSLETPLATFSSYTDMTPYWRWQYLQWLSGDVSVENVPLDVLFLYLHGLEIKMFLDTNTKDSQRSAILKNVIKLKDPTIQRAGVSDYGIKSFFNEFIDCAITKYFPSTPIEYVSETEMYDYRAYKSYILEQAIGDKRAISCDFAYDLALNTLDFGRIVPPKYSNHQKSRFDHHFKTQHPRGLRISKSEGVSRHSYSIMSRSITNKAFEPEHRYISSEVYESKINNWEISNAIKEPYWAIEREFSSYNKFIANNDGNETLSAIFALPNYIDIHADEKVIGFKTYLEANFGNNEYLVLEVDELLRHWEYLRKDEKMLPKKYIDAMIGAFQILGYGIAPNYNIDKKRFDFNDQVVLYRNSELAKVEMNNAYARMEVFVKMATQIIYSNNKAIEDRDFIYKYITTQIDSKINQKQLMAYSEWLLLNKQRFDAKLKVITPLLFNESQRIDTCDVLLGLCCVGGSANTKRVEVAKKILPLFGVDNSDIHSRIHRIFTGEIDNFVTVEKHSNATEFAIPKKEDIKPKFYINTNKLSEIEKETQESQKILSEIFDNDEVPSIIKVAETPNADLEVLNILLTKESWNRSEVEIICKERGAMIGSLLEKLNDYAYAKVNDAVIDDDGEVIYVTTEYKKQLI